MSKSSIYESKWTNLVFENKNKEYGAYQLRQENPKTTITALFMALLLIAGLGSVSMLISKFRTAPVVEPTTIFEIPITPVDLSPIDVKPEPPAPVTPVQQTAAASPDVQLTNPVVVATAQATPDVIAPNTQNTSSVDNASTGTGTSVNAIPSTSNGGGDAVEPVDTGNSIVNTAVLDKMPEFPGGMAKFYTYVGNNFTRPELDAERTLKVYVSFVIEKDGSITDIMVRNDPGYGVGKEAIRVLKSLKTKWSPGILNGKAVRTAYNLPITIKSEVE
ncbi:energy transducer TonB [Flavobacterium pectinovorum]|uniref:energy transducer TonB n=1 Tax=Flavobacterium pectinovorum TaxID=29533 RepID=UPI00265F75E9|nr:energy transducer TonB [Flavobacterium pectinovorum]WKL45871.1 energy transducer TonB [Flavobacterium pectinovorum]